MAESFAEYSFRIGMLKVSNGSAIKVSAPIYSKNKDIKIIIQKCYIETKNGQHSLFIPSQNNVFELKAGAMKRFEFSFPASEINSYSDGSGMGFRILNETDSIAVNAIFVFRHSIGWSLQEVTDKAYVISGYDEDKTGDSVIDELKSNAVLPEGNKLEDVLFANAEDEDEKGSEMDRPFVTSIDDMDLSARAYNCLKRAGIYTVEDLVDRTFEDMMRIRNLGRKSLEEVLQKLAELGLELKPSAEDIENSKHRSAFRGWLNQQLGMARWPFSDENLLMVLNQLGIRIHSLYSEDDPATIRLYASELVMKRSRCGLRDSKEYGKAVELLLDYAEFLDWLRKPGNSLEKMLDIPGYAKCTSLRELRRKVARANQIPYDTEECDNLGPCWGTCPKCDEEAAYLDRELQKKKEEGEHIILKGLGDEVLDMYGKYAETSPRPSIADGGLSFGGLSMANEENGDASWGSEVYFESDESDIVEDTNERKDVCKGSLFI